MIVLHVMRNNRVLFSIMSLVVRGATRAFGLKSIDPKMRFIRSCMIITDALYQDVETFFLQYPSHDGGFYAKNLYPCRATGFLLTYNTPLPILFPSKSKFLSNQKDA